MTSTCSPSAKSEASTCSPSAGASLRPSSGTSRRTRVGGTLARAYRPATGLVTRAGRSSTSPSCTASYPSRSACLRWTTTHGPALSTVTGRAAPSVPNTCVMPIFCPMIPVTIARFPTRSDAVWPYACSLPNALISTSTPAGRSSFISASTVCDVGSKMSIRRL